MNCKDKDKNIKENHKIYIKVALSLSNLPKTGI